MRRFRWLAMLLAVLVLFAPLRAQEPGENLPPLNLPPLPGEEGPAEDLNLPDPNEERPDIPPPPPPLPLPEGPAVVKPNIPVSGNRFFKLLYADELVGYSTFQVSSTMKLGGEEFVILQSQGEMKLGFGAVEPSTFFAKLALDRNDLRPSYYKCMQKSGGSSFEVECVYSDTMVAQTNRTGDAKSVHFHNYTGRPPALLFNNLWGHIDTFPEHYWLLVRSAVNGGILDAYDPILRGGGDLVVYDPKSETIDWNGTKLNTKIYPVSDLKGTLLARVRVKADDLELLEVDEVGSGLRMVRTDSSVVAKVAKVKGVDLLSHRVVPSNVVFSDPDRLTSLEADVEISLRGGQFADHRIPGYRQYFTGELREGYMKGRVVVRSVPRQGGYTTKYPLKGPLSPEIEAYTKAGPGVESEFPALVLKARELTWKSGTTFEAARRLMNFTSQVEEGVSLPSARYALESGVGNPESKALLFIAMARAAGLPARRVGGLLFRDGSFVPHHWAEVWLGESETWCPFDPTTAEAGRVGATHIALWESGDVQDLHIKVTDYAPRAASKVAYVNQELNWGVGEERVYAIMRDGQKVGEEVAAIKELLVEGSDEVYRFVAHSEIQEGEKTQSIDCQALLSPVGLPVKVAMRDNQNNQENFEFLADTARCETTLANGKPSVRDVPFARGTYLTDPRVLSQWALVVGQTPKGENSQEEEQRYSFYIFLPQELKTREMVLEGAQDETVTLPDGSEVSARKLEADSGMAFYLNDKNQVVKIDIPSQKIELLLEETRTSLGTNLE